MKQTGMWKRLVILALVIAAVMAASAVSVLAQGEELIAIGSYGQTTTDKVFFRKTASEQSTYWARLPAGWQLQVLKTTTTGKGNSKILWYKVKGGVPSAPTRTYTGYIQAEFFTAAGEVNPTNPPTAVTATPKPASSTSASGYVRTVKTGVNIRKTPNGTVLTAKEDSKIPYNTVLSFNAGPTHAGGYDWVRVTYRGVTGYIRSDCWVRTNASGKQISASAPTAAPAIVLPEGTQALGTVVLTAGGVNFRQSPNGAILARLNKNTKLNYYSTELDKNQKLWYLVYSNDAAAYGYVLGTLAKVTSGATVPPPAATATPAPTSDGMPSKGTLITTADKLNIRKTPSLQAALVDKLPLAGVAFNFTDSKLVGGVTWYRITYNGRVGWLHGSFVRVTSSSESSSGSKTTPKPVSSTTAVPDPSTFSDVAFTTSDKVFIRKASSMSAKKLTTVAKDGTRLVYMGQYETEKVDSKTTYTWYKVQYGKVTGWMRGEYIRILTQEEKKVYILTGDADSPLEASYTTLSKGSEGDDVKKLQQALADQGYLSESDVTGTYTTATEKAVIAFQKANGLTQDGIAGEKTQHALYNTVPSGTYESGTVEAKLYPVEKVDWFTGDIQQVWSISGTAVITDVYTGISFRAYRIFGGNHADAVPLTADDTAAYCKIYGTSNVQEIADRDSSMQNWRRRPLWVTVGGRTFAASMYGVPHNFSNATVQSTNKRLNNHSVGQFCVHFINSKTHDSSTSKAHVDYDTRDNANFGHQSAIQYAYTHSISGTK